VRRLLLLVSSLATVLALGGLAAWTQVDTARQVADVHATDRLQLQSTLAGLTGQYLDFTFLAVQTAADSEAWSLRPGDRADAGRLQHLARTSPLASYGAALMSLTGSALSSYTSGAPLPAPHTAGYAPLRAALLAGHPGLSTAMPSGTAWVVAFAVPVRRSGQPVALLVSFADIRRWPLQGYDAQLRLGHTAEPYVLDETGVVVASGLAEAVGSRFAQLPAAQLRGPAGTAHVVRDGRHLVITHATTPQGWTALTVQDESAYSGTLAAGRRRGLIALVVLLTLVVALLVLFHNKRQLVLRKLADDRLYDPLTGLAQRRLFEIRLEAALARQRRSGRPLALLYCDLDGFKAVNDRHGHSTGDALLTLVAHRLSEVVRDEDMVVRLGGDEFAVLLEGTDPAEARALVERIYVHVQAPAALHSSLHEPRISVGGAVLLDAARAAELVHEADLAMYAVKTRREPTRVLVTELRAHRSDPSAIPRTRESELAEFVLPEPDRTVGAPEPGCSTQS
jgi:diguanylate cyclase (GGDEF)-like protein